ncbi:unnamed protein product, partial [Pylaiella littoralis]
RRGACVERSRQEWKDVIRPLVEDGSFKTRFRMQPGEFRKLCKMLRGRLQYNSVRGKGHNGTVAGEWALAMASSTAYAKIKDGIDAINICGRLRIKWPRTDEELRESSSGFRARSSQLDPVLKHCVGALDGVLIRRTKPSIKEHPCPDRFFSGHKMTVGMNYQVICDARYTVIAACCNTPGSTNDRLAYREANFDTLVESLQGKYYVLGDAAYGRGDQ